MKEKIRALLVRARHEPIDSLRLALEAQGMEVSAAKNCADAALALWSENPPHLLFTEIQLTDGSWADVLTLAAKASLPVNVIVVAPFADVSLYVYAIERGAFDFIVPPLTEAELQHVVSIAAENALNRRGQRHGALAAEALAANCLPGNVESL